MNICVKFDCKMPSAKNYCALCNNLLKRRHVEKRVASHAQQQHGEQESGCSIKKSITRQVVEDWLQIFWEYS